MKLTLKAAHALLLATARPVVQRFQEALEQPEQAWRERLNTLLKQAEQTEFGRTLGLSPRVRLEHVRARLPLTTWSDWESHIETQRMTGRSVVSVGCRRYRPTSGSTPLKWLPYPPAFQDELDGAFSPWMSDLHRLEPQLSGGRHYLSLSWPTDALRGQTDITQDEDFFPWWKLAALRSIRAVPTSIHHAQDSHAALVATLAWLVATPSLRFLSVWSPTFLLELLHALLPARPLLIESLRSGRWAELPELPRTALERVPCPKAPDVAALLYDWDGTITPALTEALWPHLCLVSAWESGHSRKWAAHVSSLFSHARFQGKGLWASEGVVTLPYQGVYVPAITSHLLEFRCLHTSRVLFPWELEAGQEVQPVLSTAAGLWRYLLPDRLTVTGRCGALPTLHLEGRLGGVDLVGEKLSTERAEEVLEALCAEDGLAALSLVAYAPEDGRPCYLAVLSVLQRFSERFRSPSGSPPHEQGARVDARLSMRLEALLCEAFHYRLARELKELAPAQAVLLDEGIPSHRALLGLEHSSVPDGRLETLVTWTQLPFVLSQKVEPHTACEGYPDAAQWIS